MLKKIIVTIIVLVFGLQVNAQEKYSDKEIGFDEAYYRDLYISDGASKKQANVLVEETRALYIKNYAKSGTELKDLSTSIGGFSSMSKTPNATCTNMGFEDGDFNGWCVRTGSFGGYTQSGGYNVSYDNDNPDCNVGAGPVVDYDDGSTNNGSNGECAGVNRISVVTQADIDNDSRFDNVSGHIEGKYAVKLGNDCNGKRVDRVEQTFIVNEINSVFTYRYALALEDPGVCSHIVFDGGCDGSNPPPLNTTITSHSKPYFTVYLEEENGARIECSQFLVFGDGRIFQFDDSVSGGYQIMGWRDNAINLLDYVGLGDNVTVVAEVADCSAGAHSGYAYFEGACGNKINEVEISAAPSPKCVDEIVVFSTTEVINDYIWTFYDLDGETVLDVSMDTSPTFIYNEPGFYIVTYGLPNTGTTANCPENYPSILVEIEDCASSNDACDDCYSFKPKPDTQYVISAWVKEETPNQVKTYENTSIKIKYLNSEEVTISEQLFWPKGRIIEGWQRIYKEFIIPENTVTVELVLQNRNTIPTYFDDIRIHPFNGNMKSFVYDPITQRLMAELDENNYSTFYEYDNEGGLIRVKKETQKGVYTIQETRSKSSIKD